MFRRAFLCGLVLTAFICAPKYGFARAGGKSSHHRVGLILHDSVALRSKPSARARALAELIQQTQVEVLKSGKLWTRVKIWASITGWVPSAEITFGKPWLTVSTYKAPVVHYHVQAHGPRPVRWSLRTVTSAQIMTAPSGRQVQTLPPGSKAAVSAWRQDAQNRVWYRIGPGWVNADAVLLGSGMSRPKSSLWKTVAGKGMWLSLGSVTGVSPDIIIRAAEKNHISHLYVESAISPLGFHGRDSVGGLVDAAHGHHIAVIAWVYPYLEDIAADVSLTQQVAAYRSVRGIRFNGIAADVERNMTVSNVHAYSELIRSYLGPSYLLVGVTYPPQDLPNYPFASMARSYDVLAPMDYWHQTKTSNGLDYGHMAYGYSYGYRFAADSIQTIRHLAGTVPVAPIGQTFDDFGRFEMGPYAPGRQEIDGFLAGSKASGAIGVSFFQWMTATDEEWRAIHDYAF